MTERLTDKELATLMEGVLETLEVHFDRLALALAQHRHPMGMGTLQRMQASQELRQAYDLFEAATKALTLTDEARAENREAFVIQRIWNDAAIAYSQKHPEGEPWHTLSDEERAAWFASADPRIPPLWDDLTDVQKATYMQERAQGLTEDEAAQQHTLRRALHLRRRAARKIDMAGLEYHVKADPRERMEDAAQMIRIASFMRTDPSITDLALAVWEEHERRAIHAYTRPFEPYEVP